ncbi:hypothetical protein IVB05_19695 [Bradyrhizobium sp. 170]|jgi:hypothetical protein|nr:hypothetical protein IVB05_19695 [Bradyrhizobium sp. 170]
MAVKRAEKASQQSLYCSFCGKDSASVKALIAGPTVFICDECVAICNQCLGGGPVPVQSTNWDQYPDEDLIGLLGRTAAIADSAGEMLNSHVDALRKRGVTWEAIGKALGVSRQAAWQRFS